MSIIDMFVKGNVKPDGIVVFTDRTGKVLIRCVVPNKPKQALKRLGEFLDDYMADPLSPMNKEKTDADLQAP